MAQSIPLRKLIKQVHSALIRSSHTDLVHTINFIIYKRDKIKFNNLVKISRHFIVITTIDNRIKRRYMKYLVLSLYQIITVESNSCSISVTSIEYSSISATQ